MISRCGCCFCTSDLYLGDSKTGCATFCGDVALDWGEGDVWGCEEGPTDVDTNDVEADVDDDEDEDDEEEEDVEEEEEVDEEEGEEVEEEFGATLYPGRGLLLPLLCFDLLFSFNVSGSGNLTLMLIGLPVIEGFSGFLLPAVASTGVDGGVDVDADEPFTFETLARGSTCECF